jgi:hypothetical protein
MVFAGPFKWSDPVNQKIGISDNLTLHQFSDLCQGYFH